MGDVDGFADIDLLKHGHCHLVGHLEGVLAQPKLNALWSVLIDALFDLLNSGVVFGFEGVGVIIADVERLSRALLGSHRFFMEASVADVELL